MADVSFLSALNKPVAILGYGVSGRAVAKACEDAHIPFQVWDENNPHYNDAALNMEGHLEDFAMLVPAAGVKPTHPLVREAIAKNIPIHSDVDLLVQSAPDATVIAVTGTNGKSTTTALIGHILEQAGKNVATGGNIGRAACSLPSLGAGGIYVLEMSSYMLHYSANPVADIAVCLNITPDHLDWHGSFEHYKASKNRIFTQRDNRPSQIRIYGASMGEIMSLHGREGGADGVPDTDDHPYLKGVHNRENIVAAWLACRACGLDDATIATHLYSFQGLAHRQKQVATFGDIVFVNDSKGTNPDATAKALASYDDIYWILGGRATDDKLAGLEPYFSKVKHAYLIGEAADEFAALLDGVVPFTQCGVISKAVAQAFNDAHKDGGNATILLSPACKSWDQYPNFEARGDDFAAEAQRVITAAEKHA